MSHERSLSRRTVGGASTSGTCLGRTAAARAGDARERRAETRRSPGGARLRRAPRLPGARIDVLEREPAEHVGDLGIAGGEREGAPQQREGAVHVAGEEL